MSATGGDDVIWCGNYIMIAKQWPSWISQNLQENIKIGQKSNNKAINKATLK